MTTFNILIATIGRATLQRMLDSLSPQLLESDCLTLVFDGHSSIPQFNTSNFKCKIVQYYEPAALGFWGHGIRNKYASLLEKRDFIMHADDDDYYYPNVFEELRLLCKDKETLYVAKMKSPHGTIYPDIDRIEFAHIGTPCGIIPDSLNRKGSWRLNYGGDGQFYCELKNTGCKIVFLKTLIYHTR